MRKFAHLAFCLFISFSGLGQTYHPINIDSEYDSLLRLTSIVMDTNKVRILNGLGNYHKFSRPDSGIYYATKGLELAQAISFREEELYALHTLALSYNTLGNYITAYRIGLEGLRKAEEYNSNQRGWFLLDLGSNMHNSLNYKVSQEYYQKAYVEFSRMDNQNFLSIAGALLARSHLALGNLDSAFFYCYRAKKLAEFVNISWVKTVAYDRIGEIHRDIQNTDSAIYYFKLSDSLKPSQRINSDKVYGMLEIAKLFDAADQADSAVYYGEKSLDMALDNKLYKNISQGAIFFSNFYEKNDPAKALEYNKMALAYKDSLEHMSKMTGFADLFDFDEQQRQAEIEKANEKFQSKLRTNAFLGSTFTLIVIAFFLYRNSRIKHKAKDKVEQAYNQLKSTQSQLIQSEKMASLGELTAGIAHEIKNPLNFVNNFSEVNAELISELEQEIRKGNIEEANRIARTIKENEEKIVHHGKRADGIVKSMLQHSRSSTGKREPTDINALCDEYLRLAYHGYRAKDKSFNAKLETNLDPSLPQINVVQQDIGRVVLNLINNAFYAVNEKSKRDISGYEPTVSVRTSIVSPSGGGKGEEKIQISVKDNGNGIPDSIKEKIFQPFFTTKPTGQGTGLGLSLSYDIIKTLGGEIGVEGKEGEGSEFIIQLRTN